MVNGVKGGKRRVETNQRQRAGEAARKVALRVDFLMAHLKVCPTKIVSTGKKAAQRPVFPGVAPGGVVAGRLRVW